MHSKPPTLTAPPEIDWHLIRIFLAVVDSGSLTAAATLLGTSQPTLSRRIEELELHIGMSLFERAARGLRLTAAGEALLEPARQMRLAAQSVSLTALSHTQQLDGTVRLTASEMTSAYLLPDIITRIRNHHPEIQIEVVVSNHVENLLERQADIALRHTDVSQNGLIARRIGQLDIGAYAHADYLAAVGGRVDPTCLDRYQWIGYDTSDALLRGFRDAGIPVKRDFFGIRCDNHITGWQLALAGAGICLAPCIVAGQAPQMRMVMPRSAIPPIPLWLTAHRELRSSRRIKIVFAMLVEGLRAALGQEGVPGRAAAADPDLA
ncbi:LysR family transcriptional regulator [Duganella rhizosphaerae]|uniref:LysR family transcriptional regulator n=1 Tax=Duganella rhizosphaerae TaxID=2885763 RepID=UPI0030E9E9BE